MFWFMKLAIQQAAAACVCHLPSEEAWLHCRACLGPLPEEIFMLSLFFEPMNADIGRSLVHLVSYLFRSVCSCVQVGQLEFVYHAHMLLSSRPPAAAQDIPELKIAPQATTGGKSNKSRFQVMVISLSGCTKTVSTTSCALTGDLHQDIARILIILGTSVHICLGAKFCLMMRRWSMRRWMRHLCFACALV